MAFRDMGPEDVRWLKSRKLSDRPVAEAFLIPTDPKTVRPFARSNVQARRRSCALSRPGKVY